jgi:hypothetical protein
MAYRASDRGAADDDTANPPYLFRGERLAHRHALALVEGPNNVGPRHDDVEAMECAGDDCYLTNPAQVGMEIVAMHGAQRSVVNT